MIKRLNRIRNIGSFQYFEWENSNPPFEIDVQGKPKVDNEGNKKEINSEFRKYNIIYGENGTGKTILVKIFKSLNYNSKNWIKKHWDRNENREVKIILEDGTNLIFEEHQGWSNDCLSDKFIFFDKSFIDEYVHSLQGRGVNHDKKTGGLILLIGNFYAFQKNLDNLDTLRQNLRNKNKTYRENYLRNFDFLSKNLFHEDNIENHFNSFKSLSTDERKKYSSSIESELELLNSDIKRFEAILEKDEHIQNLINLETVEPIPKISIAKVERLFEFTVSQGTLEVLNKIQSKEDFISFGLELIKKQDLDKCPFCEQNIKKRNKYLHIIQEYKEIFNEEFEKRKNEIEIELDEYNKATMNLLSIKEPKNNKKLIREVNKYLSWSKDLPNLYLEIEEENKLKKEIKQISEKKDNLLSKVNTNFRNEIKFIYDKINRSISRYNSEVLGINKSVAKLKKDIKTGIVEQKKSKLESKVKTFIEKKFCLDNFDAIESIFLRKKIYKNNKKVLGSLDKLFEKYRNKVQQKFDKFVNDYLSDIKYYLKEFCPPLKIVNIAKTRSKYDARASQILCGFELQYKNKDILSELSEGEKQAIALAYFFSYLKKVQSKDETIIVFDDPITSFDAGKRKTTANKIHDLTTDFRQIFAFTCDPLFRYYCCKYRSDKLGGTRNAYQIFKSASSSIHFRERGKITIYNAFKSEFKEIDNITGTDENIVVFGQKLRFCLEEIKDNYLGYYHEDFSKILNQVKKSDFDKLKKSIDELLEIYNYCNTGGLAHYPRNGQTSWDELKAYIEKYLQLDL